MLNLTATIIATIIAASILNSLPKLSQEHTSDITSMTQEQRIEKAKALYEEGYQEAARRKEELIAFLEK